ncbi:hypothetical protein [Streptomyces sp. NPDC053560]|uniref:hypothetical protein n=1 Tax=Streptomyces sp. NPDC053560 TaxID=3365711 RepID=UPI0037D5E6BC
MAGFRDFLARFRPAGAPGAAGVVGVPADRSDRIAAEAEPSLALMQRVETEAASLREQASREAARRRADAAHRAAEIVSRAREEAHAVRAHTAERMNAETAAEIARCEAEGKLAVEELRQRAQERTPALVARIVAQAADELASFGDHTSQRRDGTG